MSRKFNPELFKTRFIEVINEETKDPRRGLVISLSSISIQICREYNFAQWNNREAMTQIITEWWNNLPKRDDGFFGKKIGKHNYHLSSASGPSFISIGDFHEVKSMDLISRW